jgi:hypothetical protein
MCNGELFGDKGTIGAFEEYVNVREVGLVSLLDQAA